MEFIHSPFGLTRRLGDFLTEHLADTQWSVFRAAVAFAMRSGTKYIRDGLQEFASRPGNTVRISVGIDYQGTSREALQDLLSSSPNSEVWVFHNPKATFHPKVYLFKNNTVADVIVGSGNLTKGGFFENYEALFTVHLHLNDKRDVALLAAVETGMDSWSQPDERVCRLLNPSLLEQMVDSGLVCTEAQIAAAHQTASQRDRSSTGGLFPGVSVPPAPPPPIPVKPAIPPAPEAPTIEAPIPAPQPDTHAMQLGGSMEQTTAGTSERKQSWYFAELEGRMMFFVTADQNGGCSKRNFDATAGRFIKPVERGRPHGECAAQRFGPDIAAARFPCSLRGKQRLPLEGAERDGLPNDFLVELRRLAVL